METFRGKYFEYGFNQILPKIKLPDHNTDYGDWVKPKYSLLSPGTELWQIKQTKKYFLGGYISILNEKGYTISPTPHGAEFMLESTNNLHIDLDLDIYQICIARFQLITAISLPNLLHLDQSENSVTIVGNGPVAIGAALEFLRLNYFVTILTEKPHLIRSWLKETSIDVKDMDYKKLDRLVIDCIATNKSINTILSISNYGTIIGLIGSPRENHIVDLYQLHKKCLVLVGLHELNEVNFPNRNHVFNEICLWHKSINSNYESMFNVYKGENFLQTMQNMISKTTNKPFTIFQW